MLPQSCPFPQWSFNCEVFYSKAPLTSANSLNVNAFPFPRHKHTGNVESFGSVYAVKSQFVQKWMQVSSHTFATISKYMAPQDDRWISAEGCLIQNDENLRNYAAFKSFSEVPTHELRPIVRSNDFG